MKGNHTYPLIGQQILLTGAPGCGKTTLLNTLLRQFPLNAGGFTTQEIRTGGVRQGFDIVTLDGQRGRLAHLESNSAYRVGKYGVELTALEEMAVPALLQAAAHPALLIIDEIGPMETFSALFCKTVMDLLRGERRVLGTIVQRSTPFTDAVKALPQVRVVEVRSENREQLIHILSQWLTESTKGITPK
jgi:nucleoside-triphosphatase